MQTLVRASVDPNEHQSRSHTLGTCPPTPESFARTARLSEGGRLNTYPTEYPNHAARPFKNVV